MSKKVLSIFFLLVIFSSVIFWYRNNADICEAGITLSLGFIDERFSLSNEQIISYVERATTIWEEETGKDIFVFQEKGDIEINFIFDERQLFTNQESQKRNDLDMQDSEITDAHVRVSQHENTVMNLEGEYESMLREYRELDAVFTKINALSRRTPNEQEELERIVAEINSLVPQMNLKQEELNREIELLNAEITQTETLAERYNSLVEKYNKLFVGEFEYDQGDYVDGEITVYQFDSGDDLVLLLAHELGHALGIDHVPDSASIMHFRLQDQDTLTIELTQDDKNALAATCNY